MSKKKKLRGNIQDKEVDTKCRIMSSICSRLDAFQDTMNQEKLKQLQAQVRIGGKGSARRKKKVVHRTATTDDKKLQSSLKKLSVRSLEQS